jgi:hypothetical protein
MAKYFIQDTTLTNIANAIREKTGGTAQLFPENMPGKIRGITSGNADTMGIDQGVVDEANRVASSINNKKAANSITFIAISDMHEMGDSDSSYPDTIARYRLANAHAGQGAELVAKQIAPDFFVNLGDLAWGIETYTVHDMAQSIINARVKTAGLERLTKCFATPGNHDIGYKAGNFDENLVKAMIGNYQYVDFDSKKIRVIVANSSDISDGTDRAEGVSGEQLQWFANALDLSSKTDAASWRIIIFSHHPLDWNSNTMPLANCVAAYVNGTTYSVTHDGISISKNYSGKNKAKIIGAFHGHVHCYKVAKLSPTTDAKPVKRIAIPNACNGRNNEYGKSGNLTFGEPAADTCPSGNDNKSTVAGQDTAFCAVTIDLDEEVIYADCFGSLGDTSPSSHAGYDRVINYGVEEVITYTITNKLSNATNDNGASTIIAGSPYSASISALTGYELDTITVTMGGTDITSSVVSDNNISIANVTGNIIITVTTTAEVTYTNWLPISTDENGNIFNGIGYETGKRFNSSGGTTSASTYAITGFIPAKFNDVIRLNSALWDESHKSYMQIKPCDGEKDALHAYVSLAEAISSDHSGYFVYEKEADGTHKITLNSDNSAYRVKYEQTQYIRLCVMANACADGIITVNEEITGGDDNTGTDTPEGAVTETITGEFLDDTRLSVSGDQTRPATGFVTTPYFDISKYPVGFTIKLSGIEWCYGDGTANTDGYAAHFSPNTGYTFIPTYIKNQTNSNGFTISCDATTKEVTITTTAQFKACFNKVRFSGKGTSANAVVQVIYNA